MTTIEQARGFLLQIKAQPDLLPPAPAYWTAADIDVRRTGGDGAVRICMLCGGLPHAALIVSTPLGARWLDVCWHCYPALRDANTSERLR